MNNEEYVEYWKNYLKNLGRSSVTIKAYLSTIRQFANIIEKSLNLVAMADIEKYLATKQKSATKQRELVAIRSFYDFMVSHNYVDNNPASVRLKISHEKRLPNYLTLTEYERVIEYAKQYCSSRDVFLLRLMVGTGMRSESEVLSIRVEDISLPDAVIKVCGKGNKERLVCLTDKVRKIITTYLMETNIREGYIFPGQKPGTHLSKSAMDKLFQKVKNGTGIQKLHPHITRHTFATHMLSNGGELRHVQEQLGHESSTTTDRYTHVIPRKQHEMVNKYSITV